jgi:hypothetical protein
LRLQLLLLLQDVIALHLELLFKNHRPRLVWRAQTCTFFIFW